MTYHTALGTDRLELLPSVSHRNQLLHRRHQVRPLLRRKRNEDLLLAFACGLSSGQEKSPGTYWNLHGWTDEETRRDNPGSHHQVLSLAHSQPGAGKRAPCTTLWNTTSMCAHVTEHWRGRARDTSQIALAKMRRRVVHVPLAH